MQAAEPRRARAALVGAPGVVSVAQIGNSLRVLLDGTAGAADGVDAALHEARMQAQVEPVAPSLEDVFVSATRRRLVEEAA